MNLDLLLWIIPAVALPPATAFLRWQLGKPYWGSYPGGSRGHLLDCMNSSVFLIPLFAAAVCSTTLPQTQTNQYITYGLVAIGMAYGLVVPSVRRSNARLVQARLGAKPQ